MSDAVIRIESLSKRYRIGVREDQPTTISGALFDLAQRPLKNLRRLTRLSRFSEQDEADVFWALRDISFEVQQGEVLGIIGRNGAGKSTLLKILSRITAPTSGRARLRGRVSSLLEVGTGFNPELTGRENVYLNGTILGMRRSEVDRKFAEIVAFSGVDQFIDTPIKRYSSGMKVRLAFSVAAHLEPEILIIDEVLAVGDAEFQRKCLGKMGDMAGGGRTVLFVSHNMTAVQSLCQRAILLEDGRITTTGGVFDVVEQYLSKHIAVSGDVTFDECTSRTGNGYARFTRARVRDPHGNITPQVKMGQTFTLILDFVCERPLSSGVVLTIGLNDSYGQRLVTLNSEDFHGELPPASKGGTISIDVENVNLMPGVYALVIGMSMRRVERMDRIAEALFLEVVPHPVYKNGRAPKTNGVVFMHASVQADYS
jgi:lipopolysaccharide transport system ATP-binding protein